MFSWAIFTFFTIIKKSNNIQILRKKDDNRYMYNLIFEMEMRKMRTVFLLLIIIAMNLISVHVYANRPKFMLSSLLKKEYDEKIKIVKYQKRYDKAFLLPISMGFSYVVLKDMDNDFLFDISQRYKKNKYTFEIDSVDDLRIKISKKRAEEQELVEKLKEKSTELKKFYKEDFFIIYDSKKNNYNIISFVDKADLYRGKASGNSDVFNNYLKENREDEFYFFSMELKKYFDPQIKKGYFASIEKNLILKELKWGDKEIISSVEFLSKLSFFCYYKISYIDNELIAKHIADYFKNSSNELRNIRGTIQKNYYEFSGFEGNNIIYKPLGLINKLVEAKFYEKYNKQSNMNFSNDFLICGEGRLEYEVYDLYYGNSPKINTKYLKYDFINDSLLYYED